MSCTIETNPSIDQTTSPKLFYTLLPPNLLSSTYRNLAVYLRSSSSFLPRVPPSLLPPPFPFDQYFLLQSPSSVIIQSP